MKIGLDLTNVTEEKAGLDVLTEGLHLFKIVSAEINQNSKQTGHYVKMEARVVEGVDAGKTITDYINFDNPKEDTARQGLARIKKILIEIGHKNPNKLDDTDEMIGGEFVGQVTNYEDEWTKDNGETVTTTKSKLYKVKEKEGFVSMTESAPVEEAPAPVAAPAPAKAPAKKAAPKKEADAPAKMPWMS